MRKVVFWWLAVLVILLLAIGCTRSVGEAFKQDYSKCLKEKECTQLLNDCVGKYCKNLLSKEQLITCRESCLNRVLKTVSMKDVALSSLDNCEKVYGNGQSNNVNIIFVPWNFNSLQEQELLKKEIIEIFYGNDGSSVNAEKIGFLDIEIIKQNKKKINVYKITKDATEVVTENDIGITKKIQYFSKLYCPFVDLKKDIIIFLKNKKGEFGAVYTLYSADLSTKFMTISPGTRALTFAHEFGHAFAGLNEEYFWSSVSFKEQELFGEEKEQSGWGMVNCDLHKKPCEMWCETYDQEKYYDYIDQYGLQQQCREVLEQKNIEEWKNLCPKMNFETIWSEEKVKETCSSLEWYEKSNMKTSVCSLTTINPFKYMNLGINCNQGYGCYIGCAGAVNAFRSAPYSIMGCGDVDDCSDVYGYSLNGEVIIEPLFPDAIPEYSVPGNEEIQKQFDLLVK